MSLEICSQTAILLTQHLNTFSWQKLSTANSTLRCVSLCYWPLNHSFLRHGKWRKWDRYIFQTSWSWSCRNEIVISYNYTMIVLFLTYNSLCVYMLIHIIFQYMNAYYICCISALDLSGFWTHSLTRQKIREWTDNEIQSKKRFLPKWDFYPFIMGYASANTLPFTIKVLLRSIWKGPLWSYRPIFTMFEFTKTISLPLL